MAASIDATAETGAIKRPADDEGWEVARPKKKKAKPTVDVDVRAATYQPTLADIQNLLLRVFTEEYGENPRWLCIRGMNLVKNCCILLTPCVDSKALLAHSTSAPLLSKLLRSNGMFAMKSAGEIEHFPKDQGVSDAGCRLVRLLLSAKAKPAVSAKKQNKPAPSLAPASRPLIKTYLASESELARSGYPDASHRSAAGWVATAPKEGAVEGDADGKDPDASKLVAMDCEMVMTASGSALARVSLVGSDGSVLYDTFVQPPEKVTDYLTKFSGITQETLAGVEVTLGDVQARLLELLDAQSILVGHSLENDLFALKLFHERIVDTVLLYPHPRGWPHRSSLAGLSTSVLKRKLDRTDGHDSIADAKAALQLALLKFEKGPTFGASGGECAPLGRLLRKAGSQLLLRDPERKASNPSGSKSSSWHEEGCEVASASSSTTAASTGTDNVSSTGPGDTSTSATGSAGDAGGSGSTGDAGTGQAAVTSQAAASKPQRSVRLTVLRCFEDFCKKALALSFGTAEDELPVCLTRLDKHVAEAMEGLGPEDLLLILSGCGDLHGLRRVLESGAEAPGAAAEEKKRAAKARSKVKDAWGVLATGGPKLQALLDEAAAARAPLTAEGALPPLGREIVSYDL